MKALLLTLFSATAAAQTYDLDIAMTLQGQPTMNFVGSYVFSSGGTCAGSVVFCPTSPQYSQVNVTDGYDGGTFTEARAIGDQVSLYDFEGLTPNSGSTIKFQLAFNVDFGTNLSNIYLNTADIYLCGQSAPGFAPIACTASLTKVASAPEIDLGNASLVALLLGSLCVLRGRRPLPIKSED